MLDDEGRPDLSPNTDLKSGTEHSVPLTSFVRPLRTAVMYGKEPWIAQKSYCSMH